MKTLKHMIEELSNDEDILVEDIPSIDLYMDQILTLLSDKLLNHGYNNEDLLTKTMINNYSKEGIITPVKGKKYTKEQIIQLLCIMNLKQNLPLQSIKLILNEIQNQGLSVDYAYSKSIEHKVMAKEKMGKFLETNVEVDFDSRNAEDILMVALTLSSMSTYLKKIADTMIHDLVDND